MTRTMYDGITASRLPVGAQMVAGYVDGLYRWSDADWRRFSPQTVRVRIAVFATTNDGHVLDCESGNCTPAQAVDWVLLRRKAGVDPTVYCNQMNPDTGWPAVRAAFQARGVPEPHYWVAKYDGVQIIPSGAIGKQYEDDETRGWDLSVIADHWPGVDPPLEVDVPLTVTEADLVADRTENRAVGVIASPATVPPKETTLGVETASNPARWAALNKRLDGLEAKVGALATPSVDPAAVKAALQDPAVLKALAHALAVELHNDTPAS